MSANNRRRSLPKADIDGIHSTSTRRGNAPHVFPFFPSERRAEHRPPAGAARPPFRPRTATACRDDGRLKTAAPPGQWPGGAFHFKGHQPMSASSGKTLPHRQGRTGRGAADHPRDAPQQPGLPLGHDHARRAGVRDSGCRAGLCFRNSSARSPASSPANRHAHQLESKRTPTPATTWSVVTSPNASSAIVLVARAAVFEACLERAEGAGPGRRRRSAGRRRVLELGEQALTR